MTDPGLLSRAAAPVAAVISDLTPDQLSLSTPCTAYDVRALVNHLLFWGPSLAAAGRKLTVVPPADADTAVDLVGDDWQPALRSQLDDVVAAWSEPPAWTGTTSMGSPMALPAELVGGMVVGEVVIHGWDLATATGHVLEFDDDLLAYLYDEVARSAELGRQMGIYGPEVPVPPSAPTLDRVLALTGRDPGWAPQAARPSAAATVSD